MGLWRGFASNKLKFEQISRKSRRLHQSLLLIISVRLREYYGRPVYFADYADMYSLNDCTYLRNLR